jgi:diguanylate cyclase (GGDEF)-like protein
MKMNQRTNQWSEQLLEVNATMESLKKRIADLLATMDRDELTGLYRRGPFFHQWAEMLNDETTQSGVLMIDIDHFKAINDKHGHAIGDIVLKQVGEILSRFESLAAIPARLGGEEFAIAVQGSPETINAIAEKLRHLIATESTMVPCTVSIGIATTLASGTDPDELLVAADRALYVAKNAGRNQVQAA